MLLTILFPYLPLTLCVSYPFLASCLHCPLCLGHCSTSCLQSVFSRLLRIPICNPLTQRIFSSMASLDYWCLHLLPPLLLWPELYVVSMLILWILQGRYHATSMFCESPCTFMWGHWWSGMRNLHVLPPALCTKRGFNVQGSQSSFFHKHNRPCTYMGKIPVEINRHFAWVSSSAKSFKWTLIIQF